jgi:tRNA dimethylallyltransferase
MKKILIIAGPTATGKSAIAFNLAQHYQGHIISADSRQLYTKLDIGTGKDIPRHATKHQSFASWPDITIPHYQLDSVVWWGYDMATPDQEFSIAVYRDKLRPVLKSIFHAKILPIICGGSGLYIDALVKPPDSIIIPINNTLRKSLGLHTVTQLQQKLLQLNPSKYHSLNHSDLHNPRRLIRAIEISLSSQQLSTYTKKEMFDSLTIGLQCPLPILEQRIYQRVITRINSGFDAEVQSLSKQYDFNLPAFSSTGYRIWHQYEQGHIDQYTAINKWHLSELQYAKRQLTWFKKQRYIHWFDITSTTYRSEIEQLIKNWYATANEPYTNTN